MNYERLLTENLGLLRQVVRGIARRHRLRDDEAEDLLGGVQLKLIENDYAVLRQFQGNAQLRTYLATVVAHYFKDERDKQLGRWRPSVFAQRAGPIAELLELLLTRDGRTFDEAVRILKTNYQVTESEGALYRLSLGFPNRTLRRFVDVATVEIPARRDNPGEAMERQRRTQLARRAAEALRTACARLDAQDRLLLKLYFQKGLPLSKIAKVLQIDQKPLYRRKDRVLAVLAGALEQQGITRDEIHDILGETIEVDAGCGGR